MTTRDKDRLWPACMDGELSASEASQFDAGLSDGDRDRLAEELRFERRLADHLAAAPPCPARLWNGIVERAAPRRRRGLRAFTGWRAFSAAAAFAVAASLFLAVPRSEDPQFLAKAASIDTLRQQAQVFTPDAVQTLIDDCGFNLRLHSLEDIGMGDRTGFLVGAARTEFGGAPVVQVMFVCCGHPVKIVATPSGSAAAGQAVKALADGQVKACSRADGYVVAVIGDHACAGLLRLLSQGE